MSETTGIATPVPTYNQFTATLSVRNEQRATPKIYVKTSLDDLDYSMNEYPRGRGYQSAVWPEALREAEHVSVTIELGSQCALTDRIAMNQTLAGLMTYLDALSPVATIQVRLLDGYRFEKTELVEVLKPIAIWARNRQDIPIKLTDCTEELQSALVDVRRLHSRSDDTIERLYSVVRMSARTAARLNEVRLLAEIADLNQEMGRIMADVGFLGTTSRARVELAIEEVETVLAQLKEKFAGRSMENQEPIVIQ